MTNYINPKQPSASLTSALSILFKLILLGMIGVFIIASGFAASQGKLLYVIAAFPIIIGVIMSFSYTTLLLVSIFGGMVVAGLAQLYVPQLELIRWAFTASATLLIFHIAFQALKTSAPKFSIDSAILFWLLVFLIILCLSGTIQNISLNAVTISLKGYLQVWGVLFALALLPFKPKDMDKLPAFILFISLTQVPFVLHQYFVLVPIRKGINDVAGLVPIDIVTGTFGGKMNHGGANAALTILCFITGCGLTALWKNKVIATKYFLGLLFLVMFPAFLNSTKISIIYLFIALLIIFSDEFLINPLKFLSKLAVTVLLCLLLAISVISTMPENSDISSLSDLYEHTYNYNVAQDNIRDNRLSRSGSIKAWFDPVKPHDYKELMIGYGIGSSRMVDTSAGRRISSIINLEEATGVTAIAAILWETGIIGLLTVFALFAIAFQVASRLKHIYRDNLYRTSIFTSLQCSVLILFVSLAHKNFFVYHIGFQTLFVTIFGYLAYWERVANKERLSLINEGTLRQQAKLDYGLDYDYYD